MSMVTRFSILLAALSLAACSSDGGGSQASTSYTLSGNMSQGASSASISSASVMQKLKKLVGVAATERTVCDDGFYYSVYCVSFSTPPVAAEGNVDCTGNGAFEVAGLPKGDAIGCFVRRYESATATSAEASTVGAIQIPAANLNGSTEQMVASGDVNLAVTISAEGTISAEVVSGAVNEETDDGAASEFTAANINGIWELSCDSTAGGDSFSAGHCKCFLGRPDDVTAYSSGNNGSQTACIQDNGAQMPASVSLGVDLSVYKAALTAALEVDNGQTIPSGSTIHGISIWGTSGSSGSYVSLKAGGEGASDMNGALNWETTPLNPTTPVTWATSADLEDDDETLSSVTIGAVPSVTANHAAWVSWAVALANAAGTAGFECTRGPSDAYSYNGAGGNLGDNIDCINQVLESLREAEVVAPKVHILAYCGPTGCESSTENTVTVGDSATSKTYYDANTFLMARIEVEGLHFDYEADDGAPGWTTASDYSSLTPGNDTIGIEPENRFVFEALEFFPGGAGFRQSDHDERRYKCGLSAFDVQNSNCTDSGNHFELICHTSEELSIKFLGSSSPMDIVFDTVESIGSARLVEYNGSGEVEITPTGTSAYDMCLTKTGGDGGVFFAKGTKQP